MDTHGSLPARDPWAPELVPAYTRRKWPKEPDVEPSRKHPRDIERANRNAARRPVLKQGRKTRNKVVVKKFDSTLGFPGEGPPPPGHQLDDVKEVKEQKDHERRCHICDSPNHIARACPKNRTRGKAKRDAQRNRIINKYYSSQAAEDVAVQFDIAEGKIAGDVPRPNGQAVQPPPEGVAGPVETKEEKDAKLLKRITADLYSKASHMMLTRNLSDEKDKMVILSAMSAIARKEQLYLLTDDAQLVVDTYIRAFHDSVRRRQQMARERLYLDTEQDLTFVRACINIASYRPIDGGIYGTPIDRIEQMERKPPLSVGLPPKKQLLNPVFVVAFVLGLILRTIVFPVLEEVVKYYAQHHFDPFGLRKYNINVVVMLMAGFEAFASRDARQAHGGKTYLFRVSNGLLDAGFEFIARYIAHMFLVELGTRRETHDHIGLIMACLIHIVWNQIVTYAQCPQWRLNVLQTTIWEHSTVLPDVCCNEHQMKQPEIQAGFVCGKREASCEPRFGLRILWGVFSTQPTVFRSCHHNEEISMNGRVGKKLPMHTSPAVAQRVVQRWRRLIRGPVFWLIVFLIEPLRHGMPYADWASTFPPAKRDRFNRLRELGYEVPRLFYASSFLKKEIAVKCLFDPQFKDPRFIQGCPIELSAETGRFLRPFAKHVKAGLQPGSEDPSQFTLAEIREGRQIIYTCGMSGEAIGNAYAMALTTMQAMCEPYDRVVVLEDDQSRFDLHLTEGPFTYLDAVYGKLLPRSVQRLLRRKVSRGRTSLGTRYSIPYTMQSGWPDTSIGDTLVNAAMKYDIHGIGRPWISIVCGDDSVTVTLQSEIDRVGGVDGIAKSYAEFGMEVECVLRDNPLDTEFCSGRFFPVRDSYVLMPKTGRMLMKACVDMVDRSPAKQLAWLRGVASTLAHYGKVDPILAALSRGIMKQTGQGHVITERYNEFKRNIDGTVSPDEIDTLVYYAQHYDLSAGAVQSIITTLENITLRTFCDDPLVVALCRADL